ncbi:hypothetical protein [Chryseobacterium sediminis]|uniref:hypothetical protein n=1 Tax=Chryseobacterium sediminis TaxID=1679494 RepID=UPI002864C2E4|nr:hypothetical protein [Chryseobacterium sediminis]MDR6465941.1 hypothetical protein [Chryseobacterium sediminis]
MSKNDNINTLFFCDETKFSIKNGDIENAIYYLGIAVNKNDVAKIDAQLKAIISKHRIQSSTLHSNKLFKEPKPREKLMTDLVSLIIKNKLHCFCYKYQKDLFFNKTQILNKFNNEILNFNNSEFQALFYYLIILNTYLRDINSSLLTKDIIMYFDRNVYGVNDTDEFIFPNENFILKQMTFCEKSEVSLLFLPDFVGYLFRKSKLSKDKYDSGNLNLEKSLLTIHCYKNMVELSDKGLFHFLDINEQILQKAIELII